MFDQLRTLVRTDNDRRIRLVNADIRSKHTAVKAGRLEITTIREETDDLLDVIDAAELAAEE